MNATCLIGRITVKDPAKWAEYRSRVPATLAPWGGELLFRGTQWAALAGDDPHLDVVVIRFPDAEALEGWFRSSAYQALLPLRQEAADMTLIAYAS
jgi:uncharacterized protein (DUF1330 family)